MGQEEGGRKVSRELWESEAVSGSGSGLSMSKGATTFMP
jgi:hypothetical protein